MTDDKILEVAHSVDNLLADLILKESEHLPGPEVFISIVLSRLIVLAKTTHCEDVIVDVMKGAIGHLEENLVTGTVH